MSVGKLMPNSPRLLDVENRDFFVVRATKRLCDLRVVRDVMSVVWKLDAVRKRTPFTCEKHVISSPCIATVATVPTRTKGTEVIVCWPEGIRLESMDGNTSQLVIFL